VRHSQGVELGARDVREDEGKRDGQVLARLVAYIAMGVALGSVA
jgi:hypothetical protein